MATQVLPSVRAVGASDHSASDDSASDDSLLASELRPANVRSQAAVVRALLDEVDRHLLHATQADSVRLQLADELTRLERLMGDGAGVVNDGGVGRSPAG